MSLYFKDIEISNIDNLVPQSGLDITDIWFGSTNIYTVWETYEGTLPATINANGADMRQYRIFGNTGGVGYDSGTAYGYAVPIGVKSSNVMPSAAAETKTLNGITITCDGEGRYSISGRNTEDFEISFDIQEFTIPTAIGQGGAGTLSFFNDFINKGLYIVFRFNATFIGAFSFDQLNRVYTSYKQISGKKINKIILKNNNGTIIDVNGNFNLMFTDNDVLPAKYQPYSNAITNIYIGDDQLGKDEYVDYGAQKVYRMIDGALTPTDPPVPLPALPTVKGTTIVDYADSGTAPEKAMFKYRKEGF